MHVPNAGSLYPAGQATDLQRQAASLRLGHVGDDGRLVQMVQQGAPLPQRKGVVPAQARQTQGLTASGADTCLLGYGLVGSMGAESTHNSGSRGLTARM